MQRIMLSFVLSILINANIFAADKYVADKAHTNIGFSVKHMVITSVPGKFTDYNIAFMYDAEDVSKSSVNAVIRSASINTDNEKRDEHLRSADFFDTEKYPEITFVSNNIMKKGDAYIAKGTFTMHGVSKEIEMPFQLLGPVQDPWGNTKLGAEAYLTINRQDYNVSWSKSLDTGGLVVSDEVKILLDIQLNKAQ